MALFSFYFLDQEDPLPFNPKSFILDWSVINEIQLEAVNTKKLVAQCKDVIQIVEQPNKPRLFNHTVSFLHCIVINFIN